jgi:tetratricopeptide (TPR) repeat protein
MRWKLPKRFPRSAPVILLLLTLAAATGFAAVSHLVARFNANQQSRGRKLYAQGLADVKDDHYDEAIAAFRAALTCEPSNSQYQLSLARALRDSNDPRRLEEAESYLLALWQRTPQDAAVNLALARVAAHRGNIEDAIRYYHNAMYGVWNANPDANRNKARVELIEFLLSRNARANAESELVALATSLPASAAAHLQAAQLFMEDEDYAGALGEYRAILRFEPANAKALAGAGNAAYQAGDYATAQVFLREAVNANPQDASSHQLLTTADLVLRENPFHSHISDVERNRRIDAAFAQAEKRLTACAQQTGVNLSANAGTANAGSSNERSLNERSSNERSSNEQSSGSPLAALQSRWTATKPDLARLRSPAKTDLPDAIMDVVFQIEQQTKTVCGMPQGNDLALLLISRTREDGSQ